MCLIADVMFGSLLWDKMEDIKTELIISDYQKVVADYVFVFQICILNKGQKVLKITVFTF